MDIKSFFGSLGKGFAKVGDYLLHLISDADIDFAVGIVKELALKQIDNAAKRELAVDKVAKELKLPESVARWLVETAVLKLKQEAGKLIDKGADKLKTLND